jgi:hypothetical protein
MPTGCLTSLRTAKKLVRDSIVSIGQVQDESETGRPEKDLNDFKSIGEWLTSIFWSTVLLTNGDGK